MNPSNAKGIIFMLLASLFFTINDNFMKFMTEVEGNIYYIFLFIFIRGVVATLFLLFCLIITNQINFKKMFTSKRSYIRGCFEALTMIFFFIGVVTMPLAEVYTLLNVSPIFITLAGIFIFKEKIGLTRSFTVLLGFIGMLIVINPINLNFNLKMGSCLSLNSLGISTEKASHSNNLYNCGVYTSQGLRHQMQDRNVVCLSFPIVSSFYDISTPVIPKRI